MVDVAFVNGGFDFSRMKFSTRQQISTIVLPTSIVTFAQENLLPLAIDWLESS